MSRPDRKAKTEANKAFPIRPPPQSQLTSLGRGILYLKNTQRPASKANWNEAENEEEIPKCPPPLRERISLGRGLLGRSRQLNVGIMCPAVDGDQWLSSDDDTDSTDRYDSTVSIHTNIIKHTLRKRFAF